MLREQIKQQFPELRVFIACSDKLFFLIENEPDVLRHSDVRNRLTEFAYIRQIETSSSNAHPLLELITESNLKIKPIPIRTIQKRSGHCLICPNGGYPTNPMPDVEKYKAYAKHKGFTPIVVGSDIHQTHKQFDIAPVNNEKIKAIETADWVIGVENEYVFGAGMMGIPVSLVPTGIGTDLFKLLFQTGEILRL